MVAYLDKDRVFRVMHVHLKRGDRLGNAPADFLRDGDGGQRKALVRALGLDLERARVAQIVAQIFHGRAENAVQLLFTGTAAAQAHNAEDIVAGLPRAVQITVVGQRFDIKRRLDD